MGECVEVENSAPRVGHGPNHSHVVHAGDFGRRRRRFLWYFAGMVSRRGDWERKRPRAKKPSSGYFCACARLETGGLQNEGQSGHREVKNERRATSTTTTTRTTSASDYDKRRKRKRIITTKYCKSTGTHTHYNISINNIWYWYGTMVHAVTLLVTLFSIDFFYLYDSG